MARVAGNSILAGQQIGLLPDVGDGVLDELRQGLVDSLALFVELALQLDCTEHAPVRHLMAANHHGAPLDRHRVAVAKPLEKLSTGHVDQADPGPGEHQRSGVGVATVGGLRGVQHGTHAGRDQLLGRDPVDVEVVDDRNVAGPEALDQRAWCAAPGERFRGSPPRPKPRCDA